MSPVLVIALPGNDALAEELAPLCNGEIGKIGARKFPDGETYLRYEVNPRDRQVALVCTLAQPDDKFLALTFAARTAREFGATSVGLVAPYLAYMRQDMRFHEGEVVTSLHFASMLSTDFDWLATVDPHLHRHASLRAIYSIPSQTLHAAPLLADWIRQNVEAPLVIGPDLESEQWVAAVAAGAGAPHLVAEKIRRGDRDVSIRMPPLESWRGRQPVLIDDVVSSGQTMIEACRLVRASGLPAPDCVAVHGLFVDDSFQVLSSLARRVVTTDTVPHVSGTIRTAALIADAVRGLANQTRGRP
jgi:ribose-phosphate pyrophosphokinase